MSKTNDIQPAFLSKIHLASVLSILLFLPLLAGCGAKKDIAKISEYQTAMEGYCSELSTLSEEINALDPSQKDATTSLLSLLDQMEQTLQKAAALEAPSSYENASEMAIEASDYMGKANVEFHQAFSTTPPDAEAYDRAYQYYGFANERIQYMVSFLRGEVPEGVTIVYEDDSTAQ